MGNAYIAKSMEDCFFQNAQLVGFEIQEGCDLERKHPNPVVLPANAQLILQRGDAVAVLHRDYGMDGREWRVYKFLK